MKIKIYNYFAVMFFSFLIGATLQENSYAALNFEPSAFKLFLSKGENFQGSITITNNEKKEILLYLQPEYWYQGSCNKKLSNWLRTNSEPFKLPASSKRVISFQLSAPEGLKGECLVMLFFSQDKIQDKISDKDISIVPRIGIPVYVRLKHTEILDGAITAFEGKQHAAKTQFLVEVKNTGNVHLLPYGVMILKKEKKDILMKKDIQFDQPVFPGQTGKLAASFDSDIPKGNYKVELHLFLNSLYNKENFNNDLKVLSAEYSFNN